MHNCEKPGCPERVVTDRLMCRKHWFLVPQHLRRAVWDTWTKYSENGGRENHDAYMKARADAIASVSGAQPAKKP